MRKDALFIAIEVDDAVAGDADLARKLTEACPVDIYTQREGGVEISEQNLDECVLCRLCLDAADSHGAAGAVKVIKLYDDEALLG